MPSITIEQFNILSENRKKQMLVDAQKIAERRLGHMKFEFFKINDFFVEVTTDFSYKINRQIKSYTFNDVPSFYAKEVVHYNINTTNVVPQTFMVEYLH